MNKLEILKGFFKKHPSGVIGSRSSSVGGGEWALEIYGFYQAYDEELDMPVEQCELLFELIGSNGTHCEADNLYQELEELLAEI